MAHSQILIRLHTEAALTGGQQPYSRTAISITQGRPRGARSPHISTATLSKKQQKKICRKAEKLARWQHQHQHQQPTHGSDDLFEANYGDIPLEEIQSKAISGRSWTNVCDLDAAAVGRSVLVRAATQAIREVGNKMVFFVLRQSMSTVQCVLVASADAGTSTQMVRFTASLSVESIVEVEGVVSLPEYPIKDCTQQVEIQVRKIYCVNRAIPNLPMNFEDAARSEIEIEKVEHDGQQQNIIRVGQDTRLNYRAIDLRIPSNQAIFRIQCQVENKFREFLLSKGFVGIHTPKLIAGSSEGGAAVFNLLYNEQKVLAHTGISQFIGLDAEMEIKEHYFEYWFFMYVCDIVDGLFLSIFKHLNENCKEELEAINKQYPFEPLKYLDQTLKLTYEEGIQMLKDAGTETTPIRVTSILMLRKSLVNLSRKSMARISSFSIDILWLSVHSTPCLVMTTQLTAILLMSSFEKDLNQFNNISQMQWKKNMEKLLDGERRKHES
ncbi:unnamed protein product [Miscanthus lutarioriparius]|uniref:Aminoacyl-tRNA synthetase class II (D/K/N) domain-containing protein n=1 Tax=Miscanthus lutarioriparius TaxID=422564 RepID=A0A811NX58_9POAL|nr:unnamed protein product [Miscanthus lutarioriparius]